MLIELSWSTWTLTGFLEPVSPFPRAAFRASWSGFSEDVGLHQQALTAPRSRTGQATSGLSCLNVKVHGGGHEVVGRGRAPRQPSAFVTGAPEDTLVPTQQAGPAEDRRQRRIVLVLMSPDSPGKIHPHNQPLIWPLPSLVLVSTSSSQIV